MRTYADGVFDLAAVARVERHVFADVADQTVRRMIRRALRDGRSSSVLSVREEREESPQSEMAHTERTFEVTMDP